MHRRLLAWEQLEYRRLLAFNPTAAEQELLQLVNRARTDPAGEFSRLIRTVSPITARDPSIQTELDQFNVSGSMLRSELQALTPAAPLAWNEAVSEFTKGHNARMLATSPPSQFHSNTAARRQALLDAGVPLRIVNGELIQSENVYGYAKSPNHLFASYFVDWGAGTGGMQPDRPHRRAIMNVHYDQIGQAISSYSGSTNFGPLVNTQVLVNIQDPPVMVVGALFEDKNDSGWYEAGEGIGNATIEFSGPAGMFSTQAMTAGGYQIELPPGTYTARATGGGMAHPTVVSNVVVGSVNTWRNLIYDPEAIPPDALEANNTASTSTKTTGRDQTFSNLSIHTGSDVDMFEFIPQSTGEATFRIQFSHAAGDLGLALHSATSSLLANANGATNSETITYSVTRGTTYHLRVYSVAGAKNGNYSLSINAPEPQRPVAVADRAKVSSVARTTTINVLANDTDADGDRTKLIPKLFSASTAFSIDASQRVAFTAPAGTPSGYVRATYTVTDDQDLVSLPGTIDVMVVNFDSPTPWRNGALPVDINGDRQVSPLDILTIVNDVNAGGGFRRLPTSGSVQSMQGLIDANGDNSVTAFDILLVINHLNASRSRSGEGERESILRFDREDAAAHDEALQSMMWDIESVRVDWQTEDRDRR